MSSTFKKKKKMKTKSLYPIMICVIFSGCTLPDLSNLQISPNGSQETTIITPSVLDNVSKAKVAKEYQAKFDSAKPRMQEFLANMACYKANKNDKFMEGGTSAPALRKGDSLVRTFKYTYADCVNILRIESIKFIAKNAFSFDVTFITPDSEEVA